MSHEESIKERSRKAPLPPSPSMQLHIYIHSCRPVHLEKKNLTSIRITPSCKNTCIHHDIHPQGYIQLWIRASHRASPHFLSHTSIYISMQKCRKRSIEKFFFLHEIFYFSMKNILKWTNTRTSLSPQALPPTVIAAAARLRVYLALA